MANHKSAEKRNRQSQVKRLRNRTIRTQMRGSIRTVREAITAGSETEAKDALQSAISVIARTAAKGVIHKKNASRSISRLTKSVNKLQAA